MQPTNQEVLPTDSDTRINNHLMISDVVCVLAPRLRIRSIGEKYFETTAIETGCSSQNNKKGTLSLKSKMQDGLKIN